MAFQDNIDRVRDASDIVDVISQYINLKKAGQNYKGACPFHSEKTPSFMVSPQKQIYHCFGCGAGGNVIKFVQEYEKLTFGQALKMLADRAGIELERSGNAAKRHQDDFILEINKLAAGFFVQRLFSAKEGKIALDYLSKRGIKRDTMERFSIGFAPDGWSNILDLMKSRGFSPEQVEQAGLAVKNEKGRIYDRFRNRLMFPIHNLSGEVVGFGGRVFDDSVPKYLNSPESPFFQKGRLLYGLNFARREILDKDMALVCEGYFDVVRAHQEGFPQAVASLGTSFTNEHCSVISRYSKNVVMAYDGDSAGESAALRGGEIFVRRGMGVKVALLPDGHDPDSFLKEKGSAEFDRIIAQSPSMFDFKLQFVSKKYNLNDDLGRLGVARQMLEFIKPIEDNILKEFYVKSLSEYTGVRTQALFKELETGKGFLKSPENSTAQRVVERPAQPVQDITAVPKAELDLVRVLLLRLDLVKGVLDQLDPDMFESTLARDFVGYLGALSDEQLDKLCVAGILDSLEQHKSRLGALAFKTDDFKAPDDIFLDQVLLRLRIRHVKKNNRLTQQEIRQLEATSAPEDKQAGEKVLHLIQNLLESKALLRSLESQQQKASRQYIIENSFRN